MCPFSTWTPLCDLRPERRSLAVGLTSGVAILGINTSGAIQPTDFGDAPPGFAYGPSLTNGQAIFRLDDVSCQSQWFAWPIGQAPTPSTTAWAGVAFPGLPSPQSSPTGTGWLNTWVVVTYSFSAGPNPVGFTSALHGAQTPVASQTVVDGSGDNARLDVYLLPGQQASDTWTFTYTSGNGTQAASCVNTSLQIAPTVVQNTGANNPISATVTGATTTQWAVFAFVGFGGAATTDTVTGFDSQVQNAIFTAISPSSTAWYTDVYVGVLPVQSSVTIAATTDVVLTTWGAQAVTALQSGSTAPAPVLTVVETFDDPVDVGGTFTFQFPRLSRGAQLALRSLLDKSTAVGSDTDAAEDQATDDQPGGGDNTDPSIGQ